jgi:hypothetical protein
MVQVLAGGYTLTPGGKPTEGILMALANMFATIGNKYGKDGFLSHDGVKKGVNAVKGIGETLSDIAGGILAFGEIQRGIPIYGQNGKIKEYKPFDIDKIKTTIEKVIAILPEVFANIDVKKMKDSQKNAESATPLAKSIKEIAESLQKITLTEKDMARQKVVLGEMGPALKSFTDNLQGIGVDEAKMTSLKKLADVLERLSKLGDGMKAFGAGLSDTSKALGSFTPVFEKFSDKIEKFQKFEGSFSNLLKNQYTFKFDKFAASMGTLKNNINTLNVENLKFTDSLMKSLAILSKSPDAVSQTIKSSIEKAFDELIESIKKLTKEATQEMRNELKAEQSRLSQQQTVQGDTQGGDKKDKGAGDKDKKDNKKQVIQQQVQGGGGLTAYQLQTAFENALNKFAENGVLRTTG